MRRSFQNSRAVSQSVRLYALVWLWAAPTANMRSIWTSQCRRSVPTCEPATLPHPYTHTHTHTHTHMYILSPTSTNPHTLIHTHKRAHTHHDHTHTHTQTHTPAGWGMGSLGAWEKFRSSGRKLPTYVASIWSSSIVFLKPKIPNYDLSRFMTPSPGSISSWFVVNKWNFEALHTLVLVSCLFFMSRKRFSEFNPKYSSI